MWCGQKSERQLAPPEYCCSSCPAKVRTSIDMCVAAFTNTAKVATPESRRTDCEEETARPRRQQFLLSAFASSPSRSGLLILIVCILCLEAATWTRLSLNARLPLDAIFPPTEIVDTVDPRATDVDGKTDTPFHFSGPTSFSSLIGVTQDTNQSDGRPSQGSNVPRATSTTTTFVTQLPPDGPDPAARATVHSQLHTAQGDNSTYFPHNNCSITSQIRIQQEYLGGSDGGNQSREG